jgi:hypothetical protein
MNCQQNRNGIDELFVGDFSPAREEAMRAHLTSCADCRSYYAHVAVLTSKLEGSKEALSTAQRDSVERRLLQRIGAVRVPERPHRRWLELAMPLAGATVAGMLVIALSVTGTGTDAEWRSRGSGLGLAFGVRAFCVAEVGRRPEVTAEAAGNGTLRCKPGSALQFTYNASSAARLHISIPSTGDVFFPPEGQSGVVRGGMNVALPFSTPVQPAWLSKPVEVHARFFDPVTGAEVAKSSLIVAPR